MIASDIAVDTTKHYSDSIRRTAVNYGNAVINGDLYKETPTRVTVLEALIDIVPDIVADDSGRTFDILLHDLLDAKLNPPPPPPPPPEPPVEPDPPPTDPENPDEGGDEQNGSSLEPPESTNSTSNEEVNSRYPDDPEPPDGGDVVPAASAMTLSEEPAKHEEPEVKAPTKPRRRGRPPRAAANTKKGA